MKTPSNMIAVLSPLGLLSAIPFILLRMDLDIVSLITDPLVKVFLIGICTPFLAISLLALWQGNPEFKVTNRLVFVASATFYVLALLQF
jgi:hypothetical protein